MQRLLVWAGWCCLLLVTSTAARTVQADKPIAVKLEVGQPTSLAFPEVIDSIQATKVGDENAPQPLSVDMRGPYCYLILRDAAYSGRLFVLGKSGAQYLVTFRAAVPADVVVHVLRAVPSAVKPPPVGIPSVLRALWTQHAVPGQMPVEVPAPVSQDSRLVVTGWQAMQVGELVSGILRVRHTQAMPMALDVRVGLVPESLPGTLSLAVLVWAPGVTVQALAAHREVLPPEEDAQIFVVLQERR